MTRRDLMCRIRTRWRLCVAGVVVAAVSACGGAGPGRSNGADEDSRTPSTSQQKQLNPRDVVDGSEVCETWPAEVVGRITGIEGLQADPEQESLPVIRGADGEPVDPGVGCTYAAKESSESVTIGISPAEIVLVASPPAPDEVVFTDRPTSISVDGLGDVVVSNRPPERVYLKDGGEEIWPPKTMVAFVVGGRTAWVYVAAFSANDDPPEDLAISLAKDVDSALGD